MELNVLDHALALVILILLPIRGYLTFPRVRRLLAEDPPGVRVRLYRRTMLWQWTLTALTLASWLGAGRTLAELGLVWRPTLATWIATLVVVAIAGLMSAQLVALPRYRSVHRKLRAQLESAAPFLPRDNREQAWFSAVALTAGVCEEILFRGFCLAYVAAWVGLGWGVVATSLMFGLGHLYQGRKGALKTGVAGLVAGVVAVLGGTLWLPIFLHVFVDVHGGLVYRTVRGQVRGRVRGRAA